MKVVMYHYVRPGTDNPPYEYYYLDLEDFRRQLDYFEETYDVIDEERFLSYVNGEHYPSDDEVILTFDDGLSDHYEWVLPELEARGLWGIFFAPGPIGKRLLPVHRVHSMLGSADPAVLDDELADVLQEMEGIDDRGDRFQQMYAQNEFSDATRRLKFTLNYLIPYDRLSSVLDTLENRVSEVRPAEPAEYYMTREEVAALSDAGMLIGGHTVSHPVLSRLPPGAQRTELNHSLDYVRDVADPPILTFAYPYGSTEVFDETTLKRLHESDCSVAFTTESGDVSRGAFESTRLTVPRRDCNEFKHGSASIT